MRRVKAESSHCALILSIFFVALSSLAYGDIVITHDNGVPTEGLPGFRTVIVTAASTTAGETIQAMDFYGGPNYSVDLGFFGPLNQVNPGGSPTIFQDINLIFGAIPIAQDSQFLFQTLVPPPAGVDALPSFRSEGGDHLRAILARPTGFGQSVPIAQLVMPTNAEVTYNVVFALQQGGNFFDTPIISGTITLQIPEPACLVLAGAASISCGAFRRHRSSDSTKRVRITNLAN